jgi:hypothetical protein
MAGAGICCAVPGIQNGGWPLKSQAECFGMEQSVSKQESVDRRGRW